MNILYISQYFPPEMGAPAARAAELARRWVSAGHEVTVLTGFPNHPTGVVPSEWRSKLRHLVHREQICAVEVVRTWLWPLPNRKALERMLNYSSFCLSSALTGLSISRPDVIIATSPQLLVGLSGWWLAFAKRIPFVLEVRDLWPESLSAVGMGDDRSLLHGLLSVVAGFLYKRANHIVVVTPTSKEHLAQIWKVPPPKMSVVANGVETDVFRPQAAEATARLRKELGAEGRFLCCYIGTMGMAHGLETLLEAAGRLRDENPAVLFLLVGEGSEKARIKALARTRGLSNVLFMDQQPREAIPAFISASDACLVLLKRTEIFKTVIPTKMLEFMSCARPVILGVDGQSRQIIEEAGAGIVIEPENSSALVKAVNRMVSDQELRLRLGRRGREYVLRWFSRAQTASAYIGVLETLLGSSAPSDSAAA